MCNIFLFAIFPAATCEEQDLRPEETGVSHRAEEGGEPHGMRGA